MEDKSQNAYILKKVIVGFKDYLTDWKNLLGHALLGIGLLVVAIWAPISVWIKLIVIACLICFNIWRMSKHNKDKE